MGLHAVFGHDGLRGLLATALASGRFPQSALLLGPSGIGKQRLALWIAQGLLCERGPSEPCGQCQPCQLVAGLSHPDLHWFVPIPRPKAGDPDKQVEEAQEALAEVMAARRGQALYQPPDGLASHAIASIRLLQRRVALTPYMGKRKVVILGDAERLVVQESSPEAANALLKLLEEPPADTVVLVTAAEPHSLLPTIRSRLVPIRIGRLTDDTVRRFLETVPSPPLKGAELSRAVQLAEGSIGRALAARDEAGAADRAADRLISAVRGGARAWAPVALAQPPWSARGDFSAMLDALARRLRASAVAGEPRSSEGNWIRALRRVEGIREEAQGNANPQLALAVLAAELEQSL